MFGILTKVDEIFREELKSETRALPAPEAPRITA